MRAQEGPRGPGGAHRDHRLLPPEREGMIGQGGWIRTIDLMRRGRQGR